MAHRIEVLTLDVGRVRLPAGHPRAADGDCVVQAFAVRHPDGTILVDTGVAGDHERINELYEPNVIPIVDALGAAAIDEREVVAIVNSHLHFDHCGQNRAFPSVPVWVQAAEYEMVDAPRFTVPDWARLPVERRRTIDGDVDIAPGVRIVATPGHTPGHQSLVVDDELGRTVIGGQCCYTCAEFAAAEPDPADAHDESWVQTAVESLARLRALEPDVVHLSHDRTVLRRTG